MNRIWAYPGFRTAAPPHRAILLRTAALPIAVGALLTLLAAGCSENTTAPGGQTHGDRPPDTHVTYALVPGDTISYRVHFHLNGSDSDGEVVAFRLALDPPQTSVGTPWMWPRTTARDTTLVLTTGPADLYKRHVLLVAAEDNAGLIDPTPASQWFSARTLPPVSRIQSGPWSGSTITHDFLVTFSGTDPDGGPGPVATPAPVDSFQYLMLRADSYGEQVMNPPPWHQPLPPWTGDPTVFYDLIARAVGDTLPYPYGDWHWIGVRGTQKRFANQSPGSYVFALRAVDVAGAVEQNITSAISLNDHVRWFTVPFLPPPRHVPVFTVNSSVWISPFRTTVPQTGNMETIARPIQMFGGQPISFSWTGDASAYGGQVVGYSWALDNPGALGAPYDPGLVGVTLGPDRLTPGSHTLYVECVDDGGFTADLVLPMLIVHPSFRDPGAPREVLYVDDSMAPGNSFMANPPFPSDITEDNFWGTGSSPGPLMLTRLMSQTGVMVDSWDTSAPPPGAGVSTDYGRVPPTPVALEHITTVVWVADLNNTTSSPIGLWQTLVGGNYSALADYLRAGGTLIVTGYNLVNNSTNPSSILADRTAGICGSFTPGSIEWNLTYFPRLYMGVDYMVPNWGGRRAIGARDFVGAFPTAEAKSLGFDTAYVDTGVVISGAKWNTHSDLSPTLGTAYLDQNLSPGLPSIEGWAMASSFGCLGDPSFGRENAGVPIARPIYTYHGVPTGIAQDGGPSPREGRVCGVLVQSHDLGESGTGAYNPSASVGRVVFLGFPLYFVRDQQASDVLFSAFGYVNASPTLP